MTPSDQLDIGPGFKAWISQEYSDPRELFATRALFLLGLDELARRLHVLNPSHGLHWFQITEETADDPKSVGAWVLASVSGYLCHNDWHFDTSDPVEALDAALSMTTPIVTEIPMRMPQAEA